MNEAKEIRKVLKDAGFNSRRVSVRHEHYSMGSSLHVTIRDASIEKQEIEKLVRSFERIDRCSYTGEILSGGNTFMYIRYSAEAALARVEKIADKIQSAIDKLPDESNTLEKVEGSNIMIGRTGGHFTVWGESGFMSNAYNFDGICKVIAL